MKNAPDHRTKPDLPFHMVLEIAQFCQFHHQHQHIDIEKLLQGLQQLFQQPNHHAIHMHPINAASTPQISCNLNCGNTICRNPQNVKKQAQITSCKAKMNSLWSIVQYSTREKKKICNQAVGM